jgi:hypothetical protein
MRSLKAKMILTAGLILLPFSSLAQTINSVYIDQVGSNSTISMSQTGSNNKLGDETQAAIFTGNNQVVAIMQVGANNVGNFNIQGSSASVTSNVTGNLNTVTATCGASGTTSCTDTVIEANATGGGNTLSATVGGKSTAKINVTGDTNTATISSTTSNMAGSRAEITSTGGDSNNLSISQNGPAGLNGFSAKIEVTGGGNVVGVTQTGTVDSTVNVKSTGSNNNITVHSGN